MSLISSPENDEDEESVDIITDFSYDGSLTERDNTEDSTSEM